MFIYDLTPTLNFVQIMKYNAYAKIRDNEVNIDVVKQTRKRLKLNYTVKRPFLGIILHM